MAFGRVQTSIDNLSRRDAVNADVLAELLHCAIRDALAHNKTADVATLRVDDAFQFIKQLYPVSGAIAKLYAEHADMLREVYSDDKFRAKIQSIFEETARAARELEAINDKIREQEEANRKSADELAKLERARGHLLTAEAQCAELRAKIDRLNDPALDEIAKKRGALEAELGTRQRRETELLAAIEILKEKIAAQDRDIEALHGKERALRDQTETLTEESDRLEKAGAEESEKLAALKAQIEQYRASRETFEKRFAELDRERAELESRMNIYIDAWKAEQGQAFSHNIANYDDLAREMDAEREALERVFSEYGRQLKSIVDLSEKLTKEPPADKDPKGDAGANETEGRTNDL
jgi:chromosome segregation ATPase